MESLTEEQQRAVSLGAAGENLKIEAYAGSGKTYTLSAIAHAISPNKRGLYLAFNKAIAEDAKKKFPGKVDCRTAHSLAYRAKGWQFKDRLQGVNGKAVAGLFGFPDEYCGMKAAAAGAFVLETVNRFTQSNSPKITLGHFPLFKLNGVPVGAKATIAKELFGYAEKLWNMMIDPNGKTPVTHDVYLKLWTLDKPRIPVDYILFDEAQDANASMMSLVQAQQAQQIWVGDRYQQIYSWRGAVNAMTHIKTDRTCRISQSFRFGKPVADVANQIILSHFGEDIGIRGWDKISSRIERCDDARAVLCRTNGAAISEVMGAVEDGKKVAVVGGTQELVALLSSAIDLRAGKKAIVPELALFRDWREVVDYAGSEVGQDMALLVDIVEKRNPYDIMSTLRQIQDNEERTSDMIVSTAHKAKGREWPSVRLANDFRGPEDENYDPEDTNILYVAATRATRILDIESCNTAKEALAERKKIEPRVGAAKVSSPGM